MSKTKNRELLDSLATRIEEELPTLGIRVEGEALLLSRGSTVTRLGDGAIGRFTLADRAERRRRGSNYADLKLGEVFVDEPGMFVSLRVGSLKTRLTPQQCAVLAAIMEADQFGWLSESTSLEPGVLRDELGRRLGIRLTPSSVSKLRAILMNPRLLRRGRPSAPRAFEAILSDFRLDAIGRLIRLPAPAQADAEWLRRRIPGARVLGGVSSVLVERTGAVIEPRDFLVTRPVLLQLEDTLGGAVGAEFRGPAVLVRGVSRLALDELSSDHSDQLLPILAVADAATSDDPVQRECANRLAADWRARWK
ncbi:hypothetical protein [Planctomycetes bacterium Poly30]|uniref:hypothetical protein n=1 Tax=Saltatorellus ferox TaxID=2528018 RepID=UPI00119F3303